jgi:FHA domain
MTGKHRTGQARDQLGGPAGTEEAEKGMPTCPAGHTSASSDFCDVCGMRIGADASVPSQEPESLQQPAEQQPAAQQPAAQQPAAEPCPHCGAAKSGRFCESCGFDFDAGGSSRERTIEGVIVPPGTGPAAPAEPPAPPAPIPATAEAVPAPAGAAPPRAAPAGGPIIWTAVVASDHDYFEDVVAAGGPDSASLTFPDYCPERRFRLAGPEMRIGRRSASQGLEPEIDLTGPPTDPGVSRMHAALIAEPDGSWTLLDPGSENGTLVNGTEIAAGVRVPLHDGDRIHLGAWTAITIRAS